jgi:outer membrane biosynthesis protein TonB
MDKADRTGLGIAIAGHVILLAALTIGLAWRVPPAMKSEVMDVQLVDAIGLQSAAPEPATEAPQEAEAPAIAPPAEAPPPAPAPEPPRPEPKPVPPKPEAPVAEKPAPPSKPQPKQKLLPDILKDVRTAANREKASRAKDAKAERAAGGRIGPDFLKGVLGASAGKGERARAALTGDALNGLAAAIKRQVQPCYDLGALAGTPAMQIVTVLQMRFNPDGSVSGTPHLVEQQGVTDANRAYARQMIDVSRRAVLRCAPLKLPAELYAGGWENITMGFIPGQMR